MRSACVLLLACVGAFSHAQMSRAEAERYVLTRSALPKYGNALEIWRLSASDAELMAAIKTPATPKAAAAVQEVAQRRKPELVKAVAVSLPRSSEEFGMNAVVL